MKMASTRQVVELVVLVDAGHAAGTQSHGETGWTLVFHAASWRQMGEIPIQIHEEELRVEWPGRSSREKDDWMARIKPYDTLRLRATLGHTAFEGTMAMAIATDILGRVEDAELADVARRLREPVTVQDATLGPLTLDRRFKWYEGTAEWGGRSVIVRVDPERGELGEALKTAHALWSSQADWCRRVEDYAVQELLPLKNGAWADDEDEDVPPVTADDFKARMALTQIYAGPRGEFTFWHDDGDLFYGHSIQVLGSLEGGFESADIAG